MFDEQARRQLVAVLREPIEAILATGVNPAELMPDDNDLVEELEALREEFGGETESLPFWVVVGFLLYGERQIDFTLDRVRHAVAYLETHRRRSGTIAFAGADLLQLVFLYGLGVSRRAGPVPDESEQQANTWGQAPWTGARQPLRAMLIGHAVGLMGKLRECGFHAVDILGEYFRSRSNRGPESFGRVLAEHTIGILLGHTRCMCAELFRQANPGTPTNCPEERHRRNHLLTGYLAGHWPAGRRYADGPYRLSEHIRRAVSGDGGGGEPSRPRALAEGIWFPMLRTKDASLVVLRVLVCKECHAHLSDFDFCPRCRVANPENQLMYWLASEDDERFQPGKGKECRRCKRLAPLEQGQCVCGSPGVGFSPVVKGTGKVRCLACDCSVPRKTHACTACDNADYGGETNFRFRHNAPVCLPSGRLQ